MSPMFAPLRRYVDFQGRSTRTEFWLFQLFLAILVACFLTVIGVAIQLETPADENGLWDASSMLTMLAALTYVALIIPRIALIVRRLHDTGHTGALALLVVLGPLGGLVLFVFSLLPGSEGLNRYGPDPRGRGAAQAA